ncbi:hypothetical protein [Leptospira stimsonii]|uniref:Outer membrane protein beta-barrel domain-containing protein n=1 Tax=Leptospira stimsonii TaxID=2202203 RepID=A0ABY2MU79_9LEPT|nr:hypothetical protein [Leptospira stimsonii]TGK14267.1 hypothetical protein EHO98_17440 [Leptospira stimsonii]TGM07876.1 hypothetical protein EHQ90_23275 [Leptospira stimsonii]
MEAKYNFSSLNAYLEGSFYELKKADLSKEVIYCNRKGPGCYESPYSIGSYYRFESELNFVKNILSDKVGLGVGLRGINSNLSLKNPYIFDLYLRSASIGPQITLRFKTGSWLGLYLSGEIDYFYLRSEQYMKSGYIDSGTFADANIIDQTHPAIYKGTELGLALNYSVTENITVGFGGTTLYAIVIPKSKDVVSYNSINDFDLNFRVRSIYPSNYRDRISTTYVQISFKL